MSTPWIAVVIVLAALQFTMAIFLIGLARRVLPLLESGVTASGQPHSDVVHLERGGSAPALAAPSRTAQPDVHGPSRGQLVVFLEEGCEPCAILMADLTRKPLPGNLGVELVAIVDSMPFAKRLPPQWAIIVDPTHETSTRWQVSGTPAAVLTTPDGTFAAASVPNNRNDIIRFLQREVPRFGQPHEQHPAAV